MLIVLIVYQFSNIYLLSSLRRIILNTLQFLKSVENLTHLCVEFLFSVQGVSCPYSSTILVSNYMKWLYDWDMFKLLPSYSRFLKFWPTRPSILAYSPYPLKIIIIRRRGEHGEEIRSTIGSGTLGWVRSNIFLNFGYTRKYTVSKLSRPLCDKINMKTAVVFGSSKDN